MRLGNIIIISAASGTGKTSLVNNLIKDDFLLDVAISHTTRIPRLNEIDGEHYFFTYENDFLSKTKEGFFLEYAKVHNSYYGTSLLEVDKKINSGIDVILEIDVQGALLVKEKIRNCILIFVLPPSLNILKKRLLDRKTDTKEVIDLRLKNAIKEIKMANKFDYLVINDDFDVALNDLKCIIRANRLKTIYNDSFINKLLE